jgi:diadenosine tetraphosphate (Ap4A) HIT family hydrolase
MQDFSEEAIRNNCPHCDIKSHAFEYVLDETELFHVVCDAHPLIEGHILVIPKAHRSCIGEFTPEEFAEFETLYKKVSDFVQANYGPVAIFEHGKFGQTVYHSHIHFLPFEGDTEDIIPEGTEYLRPLAKLADLYDVFAQDGGYLLLGVSGKLWTVDPELAAPRFFRDRFANVLGGPERGNWKTAHHDPHIMHQMSQDNHNVQKLWRQT